ncbi:putative holin-like toxin [Alicyclobacillus mali (ex Roth et al. 2021)]|nr:putative holin-like toxin [Alicyclobacillus mali (ex Roth et al. 2021)]
MEQALGLPPTCQWPGGGDAMTVADALSLMIQFGSFVVALISLLVALVTLLRRK